MTRMLLKALALCLVAVATSLAILAVVGKPGGFVHTEPPPQPALVDPNPGESVPAPAPEPVPTESTVPPGGAVPGLVPQGRKRRAAKPARESPESPGPRERSFTDEAEPQEEPAQPRSWWRRVFQRGTGAVSGVPRS
jgi:hypothetical protein